MITTIAHCNSCAGERNHEVLHSEHESWQDEEWSTSGWDTHEMLKCCGCNAIKLRHTSLHEYSGGPIVTYFPAPACRPSPAWFNELFFMKLSSNDKFVKHILQEIYSALYHNLPSLAAMGVRSLLENIMVSQVGDQGSFACNLKVFEEGGYVSRIQREHLETVLEAGHAVARRAYLPSERDVIALVDIAEHIVESIYLNEDKVKSLKSSVPPRPARAKREE